MFQVEGQIHSIYKDGHPQQGHNSRKPQTDHVHSRKAVDAKTSLGEALPAWFKGQENLPVLYYYDSFAVLLLKGHQDTGLRTWSCQRASHRCQVPSRKRSL